MNRGSTRLGKFVVPMDFWELDRALGEKGDAGPLWEALIRDIFSKVIVVRAEMRYDTRGIEYVGISPLFAECPHGSTPTEYGVSVTQWWRVQKDEFGVPRGQEVVRYQFAFVEGLGGVVNVWEQEGS